MVPSGSMTVGYSKVRRREKLSMEGYVIKASYQGQNKFIALPDVYRRIHEWVLERCEDSDSIYCSDDMSPVEENLSRELNTYLDGRVEELYGIDKDDFYTEWVDNGQFDPYIEVIPF